MRMCSLPANSYRQNGLSGTAGSRIMKWKLICQIQTSNADHSVTKIFRMLPKHWQYLAKLLQILYIENWMAISEWICSKCEVIGGRKPDSYFLHFCSTDWAPLSGSIGLFMVEGMNSLISKLVTSEKIIT